MRGFIFRWAVAAFLWFVIPAANARQIFSERVKGVRLYGQTEADLPVVRQASAPMRLEFDVLDQAPPNLRLRFTHCDRDWNPTQTIFVNDDLRLRTRSDLPYEYAPQGVQGYSFQYRVVIPQEPQFEGFPFSGNYILEIYDVDRKELLAQGRFFVAESLIHPRMIVTNRQDPRFVNPWNQVNQVSVAFTVPELDSAAGMASSIADFRTVDLYKNREITRRWRIDADDDDPDTFIEGFGTARLRFRIDNVQPGNEYRVADLRDIDFYPQDRPVRLRGGADVSRFLAKPASDNNGASTVMSGNRYAEYLNLILELVWDGGHDSVFVVGDFNGWDTTRGGPMMKNGNRYSWKVSVRRGRYDYQYVVGDDWIALEGNDWRTVNNYTAFIYYRDPRFGGFDRIAGFVSGQSPGGTEVTEQP